MTQSEIEQKQLEKQVVSTLASEITPWKIVNEVPDPDTIDKVLFDIKNKDINTPLNVGNLDQLLHIFNDILSGDTQALKRPEFQALNIDAMSQAIQWILNTNQNEIFQKLIMTEPWRLNFKPIKYKDGHVGGPPTMDQFLTRQFIGPMADSLYIPLKNDLIKFWDPLTPSRTLCLCGCIGYGKEQPLDSKIYESKSKWFYMGDAKIGQKVLTPSGESRIIQLHPQGIKPVYKINLSDGRSVKCGINHKWKVSYRKDQFNHKIWEVVNTKFLIENKNLKFEIPTI